VIEPVGADQAHWHFRGHSLRRVCIVQRLHSLISGLIWLVRRWLWNCWKKKKHYAIELLYWRDEAITH
jgi:hypothetical protein